MSDPAGPTTAGPGRRLPERLAAAEHEGGVFGRAREVAAIVAALNSAEPGAPAVAVVSGEAGIGKTRLAAEAASRALAEGAAVLYGRSELESVVPYQPFAEALGQLAADLPPAAAAQLGAEVAEAARLAPALHDRLEAAGVTVAPAAEDVGEQRYRLFGAVRALLAAAAEAAPLLVVVDDLHWADRATLLLLRHLLTAPEAPRALLLLAHRGDELAHPDLLADALTEPERRRRVTRLELAGLDVDALAGMVAERGRGGDRVAADAVAERLRDDTGGNPFFALELLRSRDESGDEAARPPQGVRDVIRRRVERLGPEIAEVLDAAAVAGREFDAGLLSRMTGRSEDEVGAALDSAARAGLLAELAGPGARFRFAHALLERSLFEELGASRRRRLHRRAAEALDDLAGAGHRVLERALHWYEAEPPDVARALETARAAGEALLEQRDPQAAAEWLRRALELHDRAGGEAGALRCELLIGLGRALAGQGDAGFRETLLDASRMAQRLGEPALLVRAALANGRGFASAGGETDEERVAMLGAAILAVGPGDSAERAALLATLANELYFSPPDRARRIALSDEALAMARRVGDPATLARVLTGRITIWAPDTTEQVVRDMEENVAVADVLGDPLAQFRALRWLGACLLEAGRVADAERATARATVLAERLGDPTARWLSVQDQANLAIVHGRLEDGERLAERALALGTESGQPDALPFYANLVTMIRWEQGRLPELQELLAQVVAQTPGVPAFRAALALAYAEADLDREARGVLAVDSASGFEELPMDIMWLFGHVAYAHVAADAGMTAAAAQLFDRLEPWAGRIAWNTAVWGSVDLALGRLALALERHDEAGRRLAEARAAAEAWGAPVWRARVLVEQARLALAGEGEEAHDRALGLLEEAAAQARRLGAESVRRRAEALLGRERAARTLAASPAGVRLGFRTPGEDGATTVAEPAPVPPAPGPRAVGLRREGQMWTLAVEGRDLRFEDNKGMQYLARLLGAPGVDVHVLDLQSGTEPADAGAAPRPGDGNAAAVLDPQARAAFRERLAELDEEIDEAERFNDVERLARAREEREFIGRELALAVGLGGRERRLGDPGERARVNVTRALRRMIGRIEAANPVLGHHLRSSVRTGAFCVYDPAPSDRLDWRLDA